MLSGELIFHFVNVILLTALIAATVLWRYRVAVLNGMRVASGETLPVAEPGKREHVATPKGVESVTRWLGQTQRALSMAIVVAIILPALTMTGLYLPLSDLPHSPAHIWLVASVIASAAVPMIAVFLAMPFWRSATTWFASLAVCSVVMTVLTVLQRQFSGKAPSWDQLINIPLYFQFALIEWSLPLVLLLATGARRLRGVAPITLAGLLTFGLAPLLGARITAFIATTDSGSRWLLDIGPNAGFMLVALPTGLLAWSRLKKLGQGYETKRFSDAQLLARTWWLMFVASIAITLANVNAIAQWREWILIFTVSAAAYWLFPILLERALKHFCTMPDRPPARTLLLLRVFGYTARTERLFDSIAARWRLLGPVTMIAAPDVIARTVDPEDFLRFVAGNFSTTFVQSGEDLDRKLAAMDRRPDPDGRYRINEFCCRDNTWQATVVELMHRADAVVMDLRCITAQRLGCEFELQQLALRLEPEQIVLIIDKSTDRKLIETAMTRQGSVRLPKIVEVPGNSLTAARQVFNSLVAAAYEARS